MKRCTQFAFACLLATSLLTPSILIAQKPGASAAGSEPVPPGFEEVARLRDAAMEAINRGDRAEAERLINQAQRELERLQASGPPAGVSAGDLQDAGQLVQRGQEALNRGQFAEAERFFLQARRAVEPTNGRSSQPNALANMIDAGLGYIYIRQGRYAEAEPLVTRAYERAQRSSEPLEILTATEAMAMLYRAQGRFTEAEPLTLRVLEEYERRDGRNGASTISAVSGLAVLYFRQGRYADAEPLMSRAYEGQRQSSGDNDPVTLQTLGNLATVRMLLGRYNEAEPLFRQALQGFERLQGPNGPDVLLILNNMSGIYSRTGRFAEAEPLAARAVAGSERAFGRDSALRSEFLFGQGELYRLSGQAARAEAPLRSAFDIAQRTTGPSSPQTIAAALSLTHARLQTRGTGDAVLAPARAAVSGLRARRIAGENDRNSEGYALTIQDAYTDLADAAWVSSTARTRAQVTNEAFTALQDATGGPADRAIVQMAVRHVADAQAPGLGALVRERSQLEEQWLATGSQQSRLEGATQGDGSADLSRLQAERQRIESRLNAVDARLRAEFPEYFALIRPEALDVNAVRQLLAPDEAILMVVPTQFGTHVVGVTNAGVTWVRSDWTAEQVSTAVRRLLWDVGANVNVSRQQAAEWEAAAGGGYSYDRQTAFALYQQVVAPVAAALQGKRHVFIAAQGSLSSLPFDILVTEAPQGDNGDPAALRATRWFADAHALIQIPSIQSLQSLRRFGGEGAGRDGTGFIGFGDPVLQGQSTQRGASRGAVRAATVQTRQAAAGLQLANVDQLLRLSRLPGTAVELESMRQELNAPANALFLAQRATEARVRTMDLSRADVLVFATHGLMAGDLGSGAEPGLVFTPPRTPSEADDGYLTSSEVSALRLNADWVILSACNTAAGDGSQGATGLSGLARAFFYAGARNLLVSHWPVRDSVAARLTVRTIAILRENPQLSRAEALQRAMREIRDDASHDTETDSWAHPNAWAPFMLVGDARR
jgi:CHAT domain-containing protein/tetratricopeptide (TPR) repeat protein